MTRIRSVLIVVVSAALIMVGLPGAGYAVDLPTVTSAHSDFEGNYGTLVVSAVGSSDIVTIRAHVATWVTDEEVAATDQFVLRSGTAQDGTWASAQPFLLPQLGVYRVHVELTDADGNHVRQDNAGDLFYGVVTFLTDVTTNRSTVTYERRDITLKGRLWGRWPGTGEVRALGGTLVLVYSDFDFQEVTTRPDGRFTGTARITRENESVYAQYLGNDPFFQSSISDGAPITIRPRPTRLSVTVTPSKVDLGESVTVSGQLTWKTPDGWVPIPHVGIGVLLCVSESSCPTVVDFPSTDAEGRYSVTAEPFQTGRYQVGFAAVDENHNHDPFVAMVIKSDPVVVLQPAEFIDFAAARDDNGAVLVTGHLQFGNFTPAPIPVRIQSSRTGTGGWRTVAEVEADWDGTGYAIEATLAEPAGRHWRAVYPGRPDFFRSAVSPVVFVP
jgi:hypothetical protein